MDATQLREKIKIFARRNHSQVNLQFITDDPEGVLIEDVGGIGMVNQVYRVRSQDGNQSVIIKYGEENAKNIDITLTLERQALEYNALELLNSIYPGCAPQTYCFDKDLHIMAMEDLSHMKLFASYFEEASIEVKQAQMLGEILAKIHNQTDRKFLDEEKWREISSNLRVEKMTSEIRDFRLVNLFDEKHPRTVIPNECQETYKNCVKNIKAAKIPEKLLEAFYREECFIHYDLHESSIFVSNDRVAVFDLEFSGPGNPVFDVSFGISNFISWQYEASLHHPDKIEQINKLTLMVANAFLHSYLEERKRKVSSEDEKAFMRELKMFTGAKLFGTATIYQPCMILPPNRRKALLLAGCDLLLSQNDVCRLDDIIESALWTGSS